MLEIQRASAGSGKTYALTRKFILHLLSVKYEGKERRLKFPSEIEDGLSKILAITFTNKATNEMKQRIVEKLAALSKVALKKDMSEQEAERIDYLTFLAKETGASYQKIGAAASYALKYLLNNYSLFHITTIDSFFQEILRTFAYEANINDAYQLEIDSDFLVTSALDTTLNDFESRKEINDQARFWLNILMDEEVRNSQRWNVFNKSESKNSIYSKIRDALYKLESEEFKSVKEILDSYLEKEENLKNLKDFYLRLKEEGFKERESLLQDIRETASAVLSKIREAGLEEEATKNFIGQATKLSEITRTFDCNIKYQLIWENKKYFKKNSKGLGKEEIEDMADEMYDLYDKYCNPRADSIYLSWLVYGSLVPYLGLILEVNKTLKNLMDSDNIIRISDTSYLLKSIIGQDDTPFLFERLGIHIENYLIDEFQDTSKMQWEVIKPLLSESLAVRHDSLIIGDPKQSIYRFRNADHTLITSEVPSSFDHIPLGMSKKENTNWRSKGNIVRFNNYFFRILSALFHTETKDKSSPYNILDLYSNVVQNPRSKGEKGYVEIRFYTKKENNGDFSGDDIEEESKLSDFESDSLSQLGVLISSLIQRGFKQKDIAILVDTNISGKKVIEALLNYNTGIEENAPKIDFISEESLMLKNSSTVELIISVLEKLSERSYIKHENHAEKENGKKNRYKNIPWHKVKSNYYFYSLAHPEMTTIEKILSFLDDQSADDYISGLLSNLQTPSLTSIVETVAKNFFTPEMLSDDAIYIATFQDVIKDYCGKYADDPASFLDWWNKKGKTTSVSSPDGMDAVQIMTIHKSKGLEFKCVILPFANESIFPTSKKEEWRWIKPEIYGFEKLLPPILPVKTSANLSVKHPDIYNKYFDQVVTDKINKYYVAFTRAVDELYIFTKKPESRRKDLNHYLFTICKEVEELTGLINHEEKDMMPNPSDFMFSCDDCIMTLGEPLSEEDIKAEYLKELNEGKIEKKIFKEYKISNRVPNLYYKTVKEDDFG